MNVLHTIGGLGVKGGGPTTCTYDLIASVNNASSSVHIDILTPEITSANDRIIGNGEPWIKTFPNDYLTPLAFSKNVLRFLRQSTYDFYHTNGLWMHINHATCLEARRKNRPYIITPHGMLYRTALRRSSWKKWPLRKLWFDKDIHKASCIHATCKPEMEEIRKYGYRGPIAVIGNPVRIPDFTKDIIENRASYHKTKGIVSLGFLGRLHPIKRIENIIRALAIESAQDVHLTIMGSGDKVYEDFLHSETKRLRLEKRVHFLGFINGQDKYEHLARFDCLFVPSDMENFGMIVPEALIVGTPVMASFGTPWESLNSEKCGWWTDNSPESIASVIERLTSLSNDEKLAMGQLGRNYILREFAAETISNQMTNLYLWLNGDTIQPQFID